MNVEVTFGLIGGGVVLAFLAPEIAAWFGGALAEVREQPGWTPGNAGHDPLFDVEQVYADMAVCADCGQPMGEVVRIIDGQGQVQCSGVAEAAVVHRWHRTLGECSGVRA